MPFRYVKGNDGKPIMPEVRRGPLQTLSDHGRPDLAIGNVRHDSQGRRQGHRRLVLEKALITREFTTDRKPPGYQSQAGHPCPPSPCSRLGKWQGGTTWRSAMVSTARKVACEGRPMLFADLNHLMPLCPSPQLGSSTVSPSLNHAAHETQKVSGQSSKVHLTSI